MLNPRLYCEACAGHGYLLSIGGEDLCDYYKSTECWWLSEVIATFAQLVAHAEHHTDTRFVQSTYYKEANPVPLDIDESVNSIITVAHYRGHYAVLHLSIEQRHVTVTDGLHEDPETWRKHVDWFAKRLNTNVQDWSIHLAEGLQQVDTCNCGPLACATIWNHFRWDDDPIDIGKVYKDGSMALQSTIVDEMVRLVKCFEKELFSVKAIVMKEIKNSSRKLRSDMELDYLTVCTVCLKQLRRKV
jgi:hypothetical protein